MDIMEIVVSLLIGAVSGWLASKLMGTKGGLIRNIILGVVGGLVGGWLCGVVGISFAGILGTILVSVAGACLLVFVVNALFK